MHELPPRRGSGAWSKRVALVLVLAGLPAGGVAHAQDGWRTLTSARKLQGEQRLDVRIEYGAGAIEVQRGDGTRLYDFELRYNENHFDPVTEYDRGAGLLRLGMRGREGRAATIPRGETRNSRAAVKLTPEIPVALELRFGAGEARLDLGGLALESIDISTGASETTLSFEEPNRIPAEHVRLRAGAAALRTHGLGNTGAASFEFEGGVGETLLDFTGQWRRSASATAKMGIGSLRLRFPRDLGVRVTRSSFLTSFNSEGLTRRGDAFYSPNWERAPHRLTLRISAALGSIEVEWVD